MTSQYAAEICGTLEPPAETKTILVVDDYRSLSEMAALILRNSGYHVLTALSGESALRLLPTEGATGIDLLLTDYEMPHMSGDELARRFQEVLPCGKVILMATLRPQPNPSLRYAFLPKPFRIKMLLAAVKAALKDGGDEVRGKS